MRSLRKIIPYSELDQWRAQLPPSSFPLVVTNGCFDLLHPGHMHLLEKARALGGSLLVGVTSDTAVRALKGPTRPTILEQDRLFMLASLEAVSAVCLFPEIDAVAFLAKSRPDIYVKGGDYSLETINQDERRLLEKLQTRIDILPLFGKRSTSALLQQIADRSRA